MRRFTKNRDIGIQLNRTTYERIAEEYEEVWEVLAPWQVQERKKFANYVGRGARVLDLGCGPGRDVEIFTNLGLHCVGVDMTTNMLNLARRRGLRLLAQMDIRHLAFRDGVFDGAWACVSIIHIPKKDVIDVLNGVRRILKDGGIFFVSMQVGQGEQVVVKEHLYEGRPMFIAFYEFEEFHQLLAIAGFKVLETDVRAPWAEETEKHKEFITFYAQAGGQR